MLTRKENNKNTHLIPLLFAYYYLAVNGRYMYIYLEGKDG